MQNTAQFLYQIGFHYWWALLLIVVTVALLCTMNCRVCKGIALRHGRGTCRRCMRNIKAAVADALGEDPTRRIWVD
jgi:hypothetical protein